ncbi:endonuclease/exonuclease/phosphatase family protein [Rhodobacter capsulatus]|uniref:Endonuclease/exonuclease/phosphatase family protein n=1 Tax=Rhodobacter capsulatus TaxID=1061 RepID=A0A4U1K4X1_RHOCA|nr:endonuclease/exonuclease/phosphatase family protein [Rhodobacter capsulatus]
MIAVCLGLPAAAETLRLATFSPGLSRAGPGLVLAALQKGNDPQIAAAVAVIVAAQADVLLLTDLDWDYRSEALGALQTRLAGQGVDYPFAHAPQPNTGIDTGFDIDGNGHLSEPRDAQGYGQFTGQHGLALLSNRPILVDQARDFSAFPWRDLPGSQLPQAQLPPGAEGGQRLATTAFWDVPIRSGAGALHLWAYAATPPVFDGPEDRNGRRNADETLFWRHYLNGALPQKPTAPFVILGLANLDPDRGEGQRAVMRQLLADPRLQDPRPSAPDAPPTHPLATADFGGSVGPLRLDYILPAAGLKVLAAGTIGDPKAGRHRLVWVDLAVP